jgi:hypothetical protein
MAKEYVEKREGGYYIAGTRVSLDSIVYGFLSGTSPDRRIIDGVLRRESLIDFQTSHEAQLSGKSDVEVLEIAAELQRRLVTHDRKTMPRAFGAFANTSRSFGVLIVPQKLNLRTAIDELLLVWALSDAEDWINVVSAIPL